MATSAGKSMEQHKKQHHMTTPDDKAVRNNLEMMRP
jgi:hypothetical protein